MGTLAVLLVSAKEHLTWLNVMGDEKDGMAFGVYSLGSLYSDVIKNLACIGMGFSKQEIMEYSHRLLLLLSAILPCPAKVDQICLIIFLCSKMCTGFLNHQTVWQFALLLGGMFVKVCIGGCGGLTRSEIWRMCWEQVIVSRLFSWVWGEVLYTGKHGDGRKMKDGSVPLCKLPHLNLNHLGDVFWTTFQLSQGKLGDKLGSLLMNNGIIY